MVRIHHDPPEYSLGPLYQNDCAVKTVPIYSALAQLVEQMTVNHWVAGSSPAGGANLCTNVLLCVVLRNTGQHVIAGVV